MVVQSKDLISSPHNNYSFLMSFVSWHFPSLELPFSYVLLYYPCHKHLNSPLKSLQRESVTILHPLTCTDILRPKDKVPHQTWPKGTHSLSLRPSVFSLLPPVRTTAPPSVVSPLGRQGFLSSRADSQRWSGDYSGLVTSLIRPQRSRVPLFGGIFVKVGRKIRE